MIVEDLLKFIASGAKSEQELVKWADVHSVPQGDLQDWLKDLNARDTIMRDHPNKMVMSVQPLDKINDNILKVSLSGRLVTT